MSGPILPFSVVAGYIQSITGAWYTNVAAVITNPATDASMLAAISICDAVVDYANPDGPAGARGVLVRPSSTVTFNGVPGNRLLDLPTGFILNELTIEYTKFFTSGFNNIITLQQGNILSPYIFTPQMNVNTGTSQTCGFSGNKRTRTSIEFVAGFDYLSALYDSYGFSIGSWIGLGDIGPNSIRLSGTYFQWSTTLSLDPDVGGPGTIVDILDTVTAKLDQITELRIYWQEYQTISGQQVLTISSNYVTVLSNIFISQSATKIQFLMPMTLPGKRKLIITGLGDGTEFSGYTPLGILNNNLVDGSGMYKLVAGQAYDTYYDRSVNPVVTIDLKIPNPYVTTAFFGS